ncbi:MAG TPA: exodeoxyribonuclease III, partial [Xylella sp.]
MRIASWNVNSLNVRLPHLQQWLVNAAPDVLGIQETKLEDHKFPGEVLAAQGYVCVYAGQKTYNGVALLARKPLENVQIGIPGFEDEQKRVIVATVDGMRIVNLYVVNGQDVGTDKYAYKLRWLDAVYDWLAQEMQRYPRLVVLGDFNIAPDGRDVYDPTVWNDDHILTSTAERAGLGKLLTLGLHDGFRLHNQEEGVFSWWDYRQAGFRRNLGLRID